MQAAKTLPILLVALGSLGSCHVAHFQRPRCSVQIQMSPLEGALSCSTHCSYRRWVFRYKVEFGRSHVLWRYNQMVAIEYHGREVDCCIVEYQSRGRARFTPFTCKQQTRTTLPKVSTTTETTMVITPETELPTIAPEPVTTTIEPATTTPESTTLTPKSNTTTPEPITNTTKLTTTPEPTTTTPEPTTTTTEATTTTTTATTIEPYYSCRADDSFELFDKNCYWFSTSTKSKEDSQSDCKNRGGHLLRVTSESVNSYILGKISEDTWIDLSDSTNEGNFKYSDGASPAFTYWASGEPSGISWAFWESEDCVHYSKSQSMKWNDETCSDEYKYVCQYAAELITE